MYKYETLLDAKAKTQQSKVLLHVAYVTHSHHTCNANF
jgi:hypothetical protein